MWGVTGSPPNFLSGIISIETVALSEMYLKPAITYNMKHNP